MTHTVKISLVIPAWNEAALLPRLARGANNGKLVLKVA
jgi:glycosyltransferase involved in cell wall biosynthesis